MPKLQEALLMLEKTNDDHWTGDGQPRMDVLQAMTGDDALTRKQVTDAAPSLTRETAPDPVDPEVEAAEKEKTEEAAKAAQPPAPSTAPTSETEEVEKDDQPEVPYVLDMAPAEVFASYELTQAFQVEAGDLMNRLLREIKKLQDDHDRYAKYMQVASRQLKRFPQANKRPDDELKRYLERQAEVRAERSERVKNFLSSGVDANLLASTLTGKSRLDAALNQRKPMPGSTRPNPRLPVRGQRLG